MLQVKLFQISPLEIEQFLQNELGLLQTCAVGIDDLKHGNDLLAVAVVKGDQHANISESEIIKAVENGLADYKHLRGGVYFFDNFPLTPSGKVKRNEVKNIVNQMFSNRNTKL